MNAAERLHNPSLSLRQPRRNRSLLKAGVHKASYTWNFLRWAGGSSQLSTGANRRTKHSEYKAKVIDSCRDGATTHIR